MQSATSVGLPGQNATTIVHQAEAYLAKLPEITSEDITTLLADGMMLVSGLLCRDTSGMPEHETQRKLASLVLAKMQRITCDTSFYGKPASYPCFTS